MFGILIQLTTFFYAIPLAEMSHSEDNMTDDLYRTYGIYEIPWENMRFFSESILLLDRSRLTINFHKLFVNLVTTYFVYKLEIKQMAISYGWTARNPEAIFKKVLSENVVPCPLGRSSSEFKEFLCMGLTRKLVILNKPSDTILEIYGREVLIENFAGCFVPKTSLVPITVMTVLYEYEVDQTDSARECAVKCREISNYFGLDSEETCVCLKRMSEFMSVNSTFCGNCSNPLYICGGHKNLAVYTTNNTRTENLLNPPYVECVEDSTFCGTCLTGKKGYNCEFVDCSSDNGGCSRKCSSVTMMDEEFGFCTCPDGYVGEDSSCEDYNECNENVCAENQTCVNTLGSFTCACHLGFLKDATGQCSDEDECESLETSCPEDQSCINIPGSFRCDCNLGYKKDELLNCIDVDECLFASTCGEGGHICTNTDGSYTCRCVSGYIIDESGKCLDEDECKSLETSCPEDQSCINIPGSFRCDCNLGYKRDELLNCIDVDECLFASTCDEDQQICTNTVGSYTCRCVSGYIIDESGKCLDEDECNSLETSCPEDQSCINIPGSFRCDCNLGYKKDELLNCIDVDECLFASTCDEDEQICANTVGSYTCRCVSGYIIDESGKCLDEDECKSLETSCPEDQSCINIPGSFRCDCNLGYKRDELLNCIDVDECLFASTCDEDEQICTNTVGSYTCRCVLGYIIDESGTCLDIDECRTINSCDISTTVCSNIEDIDECGDHQTCDTTSTECVNIPSSFVCSCLRGYHKMDWFRCADVNECETPAISCPEGVPCINLPGSFDCLCPEGSSKSEYGHTTLCDDVDECEVPDICDATSSFCLNTRPLYVCLCRKGFASVDNFTCVPFSDDANDTNDTTTMLTTGYPSEEHDGLDAFNISLAVLILSIVTVTFILVYFFGKQSRHVSPRKYSTTTSLTVVSSVS